MHPEMLPGEVFIANSSEEYYDQIGWKTKRCGDVAYDWYSNEVEGLFPVFAQESEMRSLLTNSQVDEIIEQNRRYFSHHKVIEN